MSAIVAGARVHRAAAPCSPSARPPDVRTRRPSSAVLRAGWCAAGSSSRCWAVIAGLLRDHPAGQAHGAAPEPHPVGVPAGLRRRRPRRAGAAAGCSRPRAAVLVVVHLVLVLPAAGTTSLPAWAATAPRLTVLSANLYDGNADAGCGGAGDRARRRRRARARRDLARHAGRTRGRRPRGALPVPRAQRVRRAGGQRARGSTRACRSATRHDRVDRRTRAIPRRSSTVGATSVDVLAVHVERPDARTSTSGAPSWRASTRSPAARRGPLVRRR